MAAPHTPAPSEESPAPDSAVAPPAPPVTPVEPGAPLCRNREAAAHTRELGVQLALRLLRCVLLHSTVPFPGGAPPAAADMLGSLQRALFADSAPADASKAALLGMDKSITEDSGAQAVKAASRQSRLQADLAEAKRQIASAHAGNKHIPDVDKFLALARRVARAVENEEAEQAATNRQRVAQLVAASANLQEGLTGGDAAGSLAADYSCRGVLGLDAGALLRPQEVLAAGRQRLEDVLADLAVAHGEA